MLTRRILSLCSCDVVGADRVEATIDGRVDRLAHRGRVVVVTEVGRRGDDDRRRVRGRARRGGRRPPRRCRPRATTRSNDSNAGRGCRPAAQRRGRVPRSARRRPAAVEVHRDLAPLAGPTTRAGPRRRRRGAREDLAAVADVAELVLDRDDPGVEVDRAAVVAWPAPRGAPEQQLQCRQNLVGRLIVRTAEPGVLGDEVGLERLAVEQQSTDLGEVGQRVRVAAIVRVLRRPERLLVEADHLLVDAPEDHRPEPAVADRERCEPAGRRCLVPEGRSAHRGTASRMPGARMTAAISSGSIGTNPVRFSTPSEVTATVSSQRM